MRALIADCARMYGIAAAIVEAPFNMIQMLVAGIVGVPVSIALKERLDII